MRCTAITGRSAPPRSSPTAGTQIRFTPQSKECFVLVAGRLWDEAKNLQSLVAIAPDLPWPVYVAGDRSIPTAARSESKNLHALGSFLRPRSRRGWPRRIYALPARYEPFGLSVLEAGLSGCALVLGDIPSLRAIWEEAALFVPPDDTDALKPALRRLMTARLAARLRCTRLGRAGLSLRPSGWRQVICRPIRSS